MKRLIKLAYYNMLYQLQGLDLNFADEVYREFSYDGVKHYSVLNLNGLEQNSICLLYTSPSPRDRG